MPAYELLTRLRMLELEPQGEPIRRGPYYVLNAADARGRVLRVVADAELGDILSIAPARGPLWRPRGVPRIIHVPEDSDTPDAELYRQDTPADAALDDEDEWRQSAPSHPVTHPRPRRREAVAVPPHRPVERAPIKIPPAAPPEAAAPSADPEPAPLDRRNTLAGPPADPAARDPLTPVYPTPRFSQPDAPGEAAAPPPPAAADAAPASADAAAPSTPR
jgi:hypothetical protein